jgi:hypothetical protein
MLIVVDHRWENAIPGDSGILQWMGREYQPLPGGLNRYTFSILIRRGKIIPPGD